MDCVDVVYYSNVGYIALTNQGKFRLIQSEIVYVSEEFKSNEFFDASVLSEVEPVQAFSFYEGSFLVQSLQGNHFFLKKGESTWKSVTF